MTSRVAHGHILAARFGPEVVGGLPLQVLDDLAGLCAAHAHTLHLLARTLPRCCGLCVRLRAL